MQHRHFVCVSSQAVVFLLAILGPLRCGSDGDDNDGDDNDGNDNEQVRDA